MEFILQGIIKSKHKNKIKKALKSLKSFYAIMFCETIENSEFKCFGIIILEIRNKKEKK